MRLLLFVLAISVGIVGIGNRAEAQNYRGAHTMAATGTAAARTAVSQPSNNVWIPWAELAGSVSAITCTSPRRDHIHWIGPKGNTPINAYALRSSSGSFATLGFVMFSDRSESLSSVELIIPSPLDPDIVDRLCSSASRPSILFVLAAKCL
jgi:hypothetical protein